MIQESIWNPDFILPLILKASKDALQKQEHITIHTKTMSGGYKEIYTDADVFVEQLISNEFEQRAFKQQVSNQQACKKNGASETLVSERLVSERLASKRLGVLGEESIADVIKHTPIQSMLEHDTIIIDPIDGTRNFINKLPNWSISVALIQASEFKEGIIALPILGEVFFTHNNQVYISENKMQLSLKDSLAYHAFKKPTVKSENHLIYSSNTKIPCSPYKCQIDRSCVYSIAKVITSGYVAYMGAPKIWDLAACIGIFRALGLPVYYFKKKKIEILPWKITEEHWANYTQARYPIIFTDTYEHAKSLLAL